MIDYNTLGNALEIVRGQSNGSSSITFKLQGEQLTACYTCVAHFGDERSLQGQVLRERERALAVMKDVLKRIPKEHAALSDGGAVKLKHMK